jgi:hypothetical protein
VQTYRVRDRIPLGACHIADTVCGAAAGSNGAGDVIAEACQFPWVRLRSVVAFDEIDGDTGIVARMQIQAPRLLAAVTVREAVDAHTEMLANIRRHFAR